MKDLAKAKTSRHLSVINITAVAAILLGIYFSWGVSKNNASPVSASESSITNSTTFSDNFNNRQKSGWVKVDEAGKASNWAVNNYGVLTQSGNTGGGATTRLALNKPGTYALFGNANWTDYEYSASIASTDNDGMGVIFRYKDKDNYYRFTMNSQLGYRRLVKKQAGRFTVLAEKNAGYKPGSWYKLKVRAVGSNIQVYINNHVAFDVVDSSISRGRVGLYSWYQSNSYFDDVKVDTSLDSFTLAVLPDTQYYTRFYPSVFTAQTRWLASARAKKNIAYVLHEGDITDTNSTTEWSRAVSSMSYLDGKLPYVIVGGNHDLPIDRLNQNFPVSKFRQMPTFGSTYANGRIDNSYHLFDAGGVKWLVIALEWGPRNEILAWANKIAERYPNRKVIVLTHAYLYSDSTLQGSRQGHVKAWEPDAPGNNGVGIWNKFVKKQPNVQYVLNGHIWGGGGTGRLVSNGDNGNKVYQMLSDYQGLDSPSASGKNVGKNGGNGYLRLLTFYPSQRRVEVKTYSPYLKKYLTDSDNQFELTDVDF